MPFATVTLQPGVNVEATAVALRAGYSQSAFGRFRAGFFEKIGGWQKFYALTLGGIPRALHAWQDFNEVDRLAVGSTTNLGVITEGAATDITPQTKTTNPAPDFSTTASSAAVTIVDSNVTTITTYDAVEFLTPVSVGGLILSGLYPVSLFVSSGTYQITAASNASLTRANLTITNITQANPGVVTYSGADNIANGDLIYIYNVAGMTQINGQLVTVANLNTGANTFEMSGIDTTGYSAYSSGGVASPAHVPRFTTTSGSASVSVTLAGHGLSVGGRIVFPIATTVGGITIDGSYAVTSVTSANVFVIAVDQSASSTATASMNSGNVRLKYYIAIGPPAVSGTGWGILGWGVAPWGGTGAAPSGQTGDPITATDWTLDNWGETLLSCPADGTIYEWTPGTGVQQAKPVQGAPAYNGGIFVATPYQALVAWGSTVERNIGIDQDPLTYRISDLLDYAYWTPDTTNPTTGDTSQAFQGRIPTGSAIKAGMATPNQILLWTDLDLWSLNYLNLPAIWGQTKIGSNCGTVGRHAAGQMAGVVYWWGRNNFYALAGGAPRILPCSVWDVVFQDIDTDNIHKCWVETVTSFSEVFFFYPSLSGGTGECDSYAKVNVLDGSWDYGSLPRSCGIDQSVLGNPIMATPSGVIYQHEMGYNNDGQALAASFTSGYFYISEGQDYVVVDQFLPDLKYQIVSGESTAATVQVTFSVINFQGDTPRTYGPYSMTAASTKLDVRFRGRMVSITMASNDLGSWWRVGAPRFRWALSGRR